MQSLHSIVDQSISRNLHALNVRENTDYTVQSVADKLSLLVSVDKIYIKYTDDETEPKRSYIVHEDHRERFFEFFLKEVRSLGVAGEMRLVEIPESVLWVSHDSRQIVVKVPGGVFPIISHALPGGPHRMYVPDHVVILQRDAVKDSSGNYSYTVDIGILEDDIMGEWFSRVKPLKFLDKTRIGMTLPIKAPDAHDPPRVHDLSSHLQDVVDCVITISISQLYGMSVLSSSKSGEFREYLDSIREDIEASTYNYECDRSFDDYKRLCEIVSDESSTQKSIPIGTILDKVMIEAITI